MTAKNSTKQVAPSKMNLAEIIEEIFMVLTSKEKDVIVKRFSLNNEPKQTLEKIGKEFSVTRERIRQIEKIALNKLRRTVKNTKLNLINKLAKEIIDQHGGVLLESKITNEILKLIYSSSDVDAHIIRLSLNINSDLEKTDKSNTFKPFWRKKEIPMAEVKEVLTVALKTLNKKGDVITSEKIKKSIGESIKSSLSGNTIISILETDKRIKKTEDGFGLMSWRHINPQSIRDKAYIVMKNHQKPLHFVEIANKITEAQFDKKVVTTQAVHNELIRYDQFVLVGRGLYALKEWGYKKGTVADIIEDLLKKKSPLTKQEIIEGVLQQRMVKKGTISLNLQKNDKFVRVGRAVYKLNA